MSFTATLTLSWSIPTAGSYAATPSTTATTATPSTGAMPATSTSLASDAQGDGCRHRGGRMATRLADAIGAALREIGLGAASGASTTLTASSGGATSATTPAAGTDTAVVAAPTPATGGAVPDQNSAIQAFAQSLADALRGGLQRGHTDGGDDGDGDDGDRGHHGHHGHHGMAYGGMAARLDTLAARYTNTLPATSNSAASSSDTTATNAPAAGTGVATSTDAATAASASASTSLVVVSEAVKVDPQPAATAGADPLLQAFRELFQAAGGQALDDASARDKLAQFLHALAQGLRGDAANDEPMSTVGGLLNVAA